MRLFDRLRRKTYHSITITAEFTNSNESYRIISKLSKYISNMVKDKDSVVTEYQKFPAGYRMRYYISYTRSFFRRHNYTKELSNLSDWIYTEDKNDNLLNCLSKYYYSCS